MNNVATNPVVGSGGDEAVWCDPRPEALSVLAVMAVDGERWRSPATVSKEADGTLRVIGPGYGPVFVSPDEWAAAVDAHRVHYPTASDAVSAEIERLARPSDATIEALRFAEWGCDLGVLGTAMRLGELVACGHDLEFSRATGDLEWVMVENQKGAILCVDYRGDDGVAVREVGRRVGDEYEVTSPDLDDPPYGYRGVAVIHNPNARVYRNRPAAFALNAAARERVLAVAEALEAAEGSAEAVAELRAIAAAGGAS